jgi:hypothetical protein
VCAYDVSWRESPSFQGDPVTQLNVYVGDAVSFAGDQDLVELPSAPSLEHCDFSPSAELASRADVQQGFVHTFDEAGSYYLASARGCDRGATLKVVVAPRKPRCHRHDDHDCHCHDEEKPIQCGSGGDAAFARELADVDARCGDYLASCSSGCAAAYRKAHQHLLECPDRVPRGEYAAVDAAGACHDPGRAPAYSDECDLPYAATARAAPRQSSARPTKSVAFAAASADKAEGRSPLAAAADKAYERVSFDQAPAPAVVPGASRRRPSAISPDKRSLVQRSLKKHKQMRRACRAQLCRHAVLAPCSRAAQGHDVLAPRSRIGLCAAGRRHQHEDGLPAAHERAH